MDNKVKFDDKLDKIFTYAKEYLGNLPKDIEVVLKTAFSDVKNLPTLGYNAKKTNDYNDVISLKEYVVKFVDKYTKGFENRPSVRNGNSSKTFPDPIVGKILSIRIKTINNNDLKKIIDGHSLQMSIENIVGDLLEEYLSLRLADLGWYCCWGNSIDAVDFCNEKGELLQIKNSDNSENSSSSRVRNGTQIMKWARRKSTKENTFYWEDLIALTGAKNISEEDFVKFVSATIEKNPACIYVANEEMYK